jgi:hypothetical protein
MGRLLESLERRIRPRTRQELPCSLLVEGRRHRGVVRDLSAFGLFVRTPGAVPRGADVIVSLSTPEGRRFVLETSVPRRAPVSNSLAFLTTEGIGLRIRNPSVAYRRWAEDVTAVDP